MALTETDCSGLPLLLSLVAHTMAVPLENTTALASRPAAMTAYIALMLVSLELTIPMAPDTFCFEGKPFSRPG